MRTIMCFGDSNTHGTRPDGNGRYEWHERWPGLLQKTLGEDYHIIEEGLGGRTTVFEDEIEGDKSGKRQLPSCLHSHRPLDLVILMLGTNDLKHRFSVTPLDIAWANEALVKLILASENYDGSAPKVLLVSPIALGETTFLGEIFGNRREDSLRLGPLYAEVARRYHIGCLNAAEFAEPSELDGLHMDAEGHRKLAAAMAKKVREMFEGA